MGKVLRYQSVQVDMTLKKCIIKGMGVLLSYLGQSYGDLPTATANIHYSAVKVSPWVGIFECIVIQIHCRSVSLGQGSPHRNSGTKEDSLESRWLTFGPSGHGLGETDRSFGVLLVKLEDWKTVPRRKCCDSAVVLIWRRLGIIGCGRSSLKHLIDSVQSRD